MGDGVIQTSLLSSVRVPQLFMEVGVTHPPAPSLPPSFSLSVPPGPSGRCCSESVPVCLPVSACFIRNNAGLWETARPLSPRPHWREPRRTSKNLGEPQRSSLCSKRSSVSIRGLRWCVNGCFRAVFRPPETAGKRESDTDHVTADLPVSTFKETLA